MATFPGGSAYSMVREIAEGYFLVTERTFARFAAPELEQIRFEFDRYLREIRGDQPSLTDLTAIRIRNRRIQRLTSGQMMLSSYRRRYKK